MPHTPRRGWPRTQSRTSDNGVRVFIYQAASENKRVVLATPTFGQSREEGKERGQGLLLWR